MSKMTRLELKSMLAAEQSSALAAMQASKLSKERSDASRYYNGDMSFDMPVDDGTSQAVSTDVLDTIEGLMPSLIECFTASEEVVRFNPVGAEDVQAAEQETDYINHVLMNQNNGFMVLYSFFKDALLHKNGFVKWWWEEREVEEYENYTDLTDDQFAIISADRDVEITEHTEKPVDPMQQQQLRTSALHDVKVVKSKTFAEAKVLGVPPEEFGIERSARSIRDCNYCFHRVLKSEAELVAQGFDQNQIDTLPTYQAVTNSEETSRNTVDENQYADDANKAGRRLEITEHYVRMDYKGDGKACLYRVTTGGGIDGGAGDILKRDGEDDVVEIDEIPFASATPIIVTHRFFGKSLADVTMDIQRVKTFMLRAGINNQALVNNPRALVSETAASENTLDDLLISRPGGLIRAKTNDAVVWQEVPSIGGSVFPWMEYMDSMREMRTGVTKQGAALDADALANQSATATNIMFTMAQSRMRLIARILGEGVKDICLGLHGLIRRHGQQAQTVRLRNQWITVDPRQWKKRTDMTVEVGLGTGGKAEQMALINMIIMMQEKALAGGLTNLVTPQNLYNSAKVLTRVAGHKDVDAFFSDPATQPPPQQQPDPKLLIEQMKLQMQGQKVQADIQHQAAKLQADAALEQQKFEHQKQLAIIDASVKERESQHKMTMDAHKATLDAQLADHKMRVQTATATHSAALDALHADREASQASNTDASSELVKNLATQQMEHAKILTHVAKHLTAPKKIIRDPKTGKALGVETVIH